MNYRIRTGSLIPLAFVALCSLHLTTRTATAQGTGLIVDDGEAALNSVDYCKENARRSLVANSTRFLIVTSDCAQLTHATFAALRNANYSPAGYNLRSERGRDRFSSGAAAIAGRDEDVRRIVNRLSLHFSDDVIWSTFNGAVGSYLWLDYGVDPRRL